MLGIARFGKELMVFGGLCFIAGTLLLGTCIQTQTIAKKVYCFWDI